MDEGEGAWVVAALVVILSAPACKGGEVGAWPEHLEVGVAPSAAVIALGHASVYRGDMPLSGAFLL